VGRQAPPLPGYLGTAGRSLEVARRQARLSSPSWPA
jgi:hypothetical protein